MIKLIKQKWNIFKSFLEAKEARAKYEARAYDYTRIVTQDEIFKLKKTKHLDIVRKLYQNERRISISANIFFDKNNQPYIIVNKLRYNLNDVIDENGTPLASFILNHGDIIIKPLREYINSTENCIVIALQKNSDKFKTHNNFF